MSEKNLATRAGKNRRIGELLHVNFAPLLPCLSFVEVVTCTPVSASC